MARSLFVAPALALLLVAGPSLAQARAQARGRPSFSTGFDPRADGIPFENRGGYTSPDGNCFGMSLLAIDNFLRRRAGAPRLPGRINQVPVDGHVPEQATVSVLQSRAMERDYDQRASENPRHFPEDTAPMEAALDRIEQGGVPEVLVFEGQDGAHAVVVYGYRDGHLLVYDPNFPGEEIRWPYDRERGLGPHPKGAEDPFYADVQSLSSTPYRNFQTTDDLAWLRDACEREDAACVDHFPRIEARTEVKNGQVTLRGRLVTPDGGEPEPGSRPKRVWVAVDGRPIGFFPVDARGRFSGRLPAEAGRPGARVRLVAATNSDGFAGSVDLPPAVPVPLPPPRPPEAGPTAGRPTSTQAPRSRGLSGAMNDEVNLGQRR
ncbi:MAG: hypothetical protein KF878_23295 [Planctomycetes bacterium]|nr:hypothetical protein [Planctomycetota bacterium]